MKELSELRAAARLCIDKVGIDGSCGRPYLHGTKSRSAVVVFSWRRLGTRFGIVSAQDAHLERDVQCQGYIWDEEECVVQYHPPKSEYVNFRPYCLHLRRKCGENFEIPPREFV